MLTTQGQPPMHLRVLIAEDDGPAGAICARALAHAGYETMLARDGRAALELLRSNSFDMVVTDVMMPDMDGFELVRAMRSDHRLTRLPVLFLTACAEDDMRAKGFRVGCDGYLVKPVRPFDLVDQVESLLMRAIGTGAQLSGAYLSGRLDGVSVAALLAFLHVQERSGVLRLSRFGATGEIAVRQGEAITARVDQALLGEEALTALLGWNAGTFRFDRSDVSQLEPTLEGPFADLLVRAERRRQGP